MNGEEPGSKTKIFINDVIPVVVHEPENTPRATIVLLHGLMGYKDSGKFMTLANAVVSEGWRAVRFDQAGSGESRSPLRGSLIYSRFRDLAIIVKWLTNEFIARDEKLILWGSSLGGYLAYLYAFVPEEVYRNGRPDDEINKVSSRIDGLISWATPFDISPLADFLRRTPPFCYHLDFSDPVGFPKNLEKIEMLLKSSRNSYLPCLIVHGMKDEIVSWDQAVKLQKITKGDLVLFDDGDHRFLKEELRKLALKATIMWIRKNLSI